MIRSALRKWFAGPLLTGRLAFLCAVLALTLATILRAAINGVVTGCEFTPYLPFVLLSAVLMRWWQAALVALASVAILGVLFMGPPNELVASRCFMSSAVIFLAASTAMIGCVQLVRRFFDSVHRAGADETAGGIVFSLQGDEVWASWYGQGTPVLLGSEAKVSMMMQDFLAQVEFGKRLNGKKKTSRD